MIPFTHLANNIDQVNSEMKDMGLVLHDQGEDYQQQVSTHVWVAPWCTRCRCDGWGTIGLQDPLGVGDLGVGLVNHCLFVA